MSAPTHPSCEAEDGALPQIIEAQGEVVMHQPITTTNQGIWPIHRTHGQNPILVGLQAWPLKPWTCRVRGVTVVRLSFACLVGYTWEVG